MDQLGRYSGSLVVVAIDFGTTYSGYAFSFRNSPEKIFMSRNWGGPIEGYKTPTSLLVTMEDGVKPLVKEIGHEAEDQYEQSLLFPDEDGDDERLFLFRRFKMQLFQKDRMLDPTMKIHSECKTLKLPVLKVFTLALEFMKNKARAAIDASCKQKLRDGDILWVLTVPAIWSEGAKNFMRSAAYHAGLISSEESSQLLIALEPEAASVYCRSPSTGCVFDGKDGKMPEGYQYLVVDSGGGTVDIASHEVLKADSLKELHVPSGGDWGGTKVDANFVELITDILGEDFVTKMQHKDRIVPWLQLLKNFEKMKRLKTERVNIELNQEFNKQFEAITEKKIQKAFSEYKKKTGKEVKFSNGIMVFEQSVVESLFAPVVSKILEHLEELLERPALRNIKGLMLVGGFSECAYLQKKFKEKFEGSYKVIIPPETVLAVVSGAVMFGYNPSVVVSRVARHTYGIALNEDYNQIKHDANKVVVKSDGTHIAKDVFHPLVRKNDLIQLNSRFTHEVYPASSSCHTAILKLYSTDRDFVRHVGTDETTLIGSVTINIPRGCQQTVPLSLDFWFGGTEIHVQVRQTDGDLEELGRAKLTCLLN